jgi:hypothetical protein
VDLEEVELDPRGEVEVGFLASVEEDFEDEVVDPLEEDLEEDPC